MHSKSISEFENNWCFFPNSLRLRKALTHKSANIHQINENERMEFLGDSILSFIISKLLFEKMPKSTNEGQFSRVRNSLVCRETLANSSRELGIPNLVIIGDYERKNNLHMSDKLLADTYESILGALYLEKGLEEAEHYVLVSLNKYLVNSFSNELNLDPKTELQQLVQKLYGVTPHYSVYRSEDENKTIEYVSEIWARDIFLSVSFGSTRKEAEIKAALKCLKNLKSDSK